MRYYLIGCEVLFRECCHLSAISPHRIDHRWLSQGLHDIGAEKMSARLQEEINAVPADTYDAILLGYALCNNGVVGLSCAHTPVVIPRAHDCITLYMGSREAYTKHFNEKPGTYYLTSGWLERDDAELEDMGHPYRAEMGLGMSHEELAELYGEENVEYLQEMLGDPLKNYSRIGYIDMGFERHLSFAEQARAEADQRGWVFEQISGNLILLEKFLNGVWDEDFLVALPGESIVATHDEKIFACRCAGCDGSCRCDE